MQLLIKILYNICKILKKNEDKYIQREKDYE